ncbi:MAG: hypothetical protein JSV45_13125 [Chromatiales bacterium]|nr:MAG: hypothetical protein JSV45_13125 [Chromatiales bacterium]
MTEHEIMWIGRQAAEDPGRTLPTEEPGFEGALRKACELAGCPVHRYVAARGEFGSWMLELQRHEQVQRLIWNGQASRLSLDVPNRGGGWDEISAEVLDEGNREVLHAAMQRILASGVPED